MRRLWAHVKRAWLFIFSDVRHEDRRRTGK